MILRSSYQNTGLSIYKCCQKTKLAKLSKFTFNIIKETLSKTTLKFQFVNNFLHQRIQIFVLVSESFQSSTWAPSVCIHIFVASGSLFASGKSTSSDVSSPFFRLSKQSYLPWSREKLFFAVIPRSFCCHAGLRLRTAFGCCPIGLSQKRTSKFCFDKIESTKVMVLTL